MKRTWLYCFSILLFFSCSGEDNNTIINDSELIGTWELVSVYSDPGDGSGHFQPVTSNKIVQFRADGTILSNGSLCSLSVLIDEPSSGIYSLEDFTISIIECPSQAFSASFELVDSIVIISYPCIEACQEKYIKIE